MALAARRAWIGPVVHPWVVFGRRAEVRRRFRFDSVPAGTNNEHSSFRARHVRPRSLFSRCVSGDARVPGRGVRVGAAGRGGDLAVRPVATVRGRRSAGAHRRVPGLARGKRSALRARAGGRGPDPDAGRDGCGGVVGDGTGVAVRSGVLGAGGGGWGEPGPDPAAGVRGEGRRGDRLDDAAASGRAQRGPSPMANHGGPVGPGSGRSPRARADEAGR